MHFGVRQLSENCKVLLLLPNVNKTPGLVCRHQNAWIREIKYIMRHEVNVPTCIFETQKQKSYIKMSSSMACMSMLSMQLFSSASE